MSNNSLENKISLDVGFYLSLIVDQYGLRWEYNDGLFRWPSNVPNLLTSGIDGGLNFGLSYHINDNMRIVARYSHSLCIIDEGEEISTYNDSYREILIYSDRIQFSFDYVLGDF